MQISSPNLKKCLTASAIFAGIISQAVFASLPDARILDSQIRAEISSRHGSFDPLLKRWESEYGTSAFQPLLRIVANHSLEDSDRYIALMGAAKIGGFASAKLFTPFLKDHSWMIRSGTLHVLTGFANPETSQAVLPLLKDPALVVRAEAVDAVLKLRPIGASDSLVSAVFAPENYHAGRAQWVPVRALKALDEMNASETVSKLLPLLDRKKDPVLRSTSVAVIAHLTRTNLLEQDSIETQIHQLKSASK